MKTTDNFFTFILTLTCSVHLASCATTPTHKSATRAQPVSSQRPPTRAPNKNGAAACNDTSASCARLEDSPAFRDLVSRVKRVRRLNFLRRFGVAIETEQEIVTHIDTELKDEDLEKAVASYRALGLLSPELNVRETLLRLLGEQIVGYYDPESERLVLRKGVENEIPYDAAASEPMTASHLAVAHELVHALQDQHFNLKDDPSVKRSNDQENAYRALIEGDATLSMVMIMADFFGVDLRVLFESGGASLRELLKRTQSIEMDQLSKSPPIIREPLLFAYTEGMLFSARLFNESGFATIDKAYRKLPQSTEQILHPDKYLAAEAPHAIAALQVSSLKKSLSLLHEDTVGELEMRIFFEQGKDTAKAARAAEGWGGDRLSVYRRTNELAGARPCFIWVSSWDSAKDLQEAVEALKATSTALRDLQTPVELQWQAHKNQMLLTGGLSRDEFRKAFQEFQRQNAERKTNAGTAPTKSDRK